MAVDPGSLAVILVSSFLIPYVKAGLEKIGEKVAENAGKATADKISQLTNKVWERVTNLFKSDDQDKFALESFKKLPEQTKPLLEELLKAKLAENPQIAEELDKLINASVDNSGTSGLQIMNASKVGIIDMRGANFSGSSGNKFVGAIFNDSDSKNDDK